MTIRTDITVDWEASPRILTVASPSTSLSIQDLVDTCRFLEEQPEASDDPRLIDAAGKEPLGGGVLVGITATLRNALVAFEARPGPTFATCFISGGNLVATDAAGDPVNTPVQTTEYVQVNYTASSSATLIEGSGGVTAAEIWDYALEGTHKAIGIMRLMAAVLLGKVSGAGTGTESFRDLDDVKDRVVSTVDSSGNRTNVAKDAT